MKLSINQNRALNKLSDTWQSSYELQEKLNTLHSLVKLNKAEVKYLIGSSFMPHNQIKFKKIN